MMTASTPDADGRTAQDKVGGAAAVSDRLHEAVEVADHAELERLLREEPGIGTQQNPAGGRGAVGSLYI